jgi:DNA-binding transcriptional LysR family regulator
MNGTNRVDYLRDLALFVAVAEARSFTKAATRLGVPTSTLSRRIAALEASLGLQLLHRNTRTVELTEAGTLYFSRCQAIVEEAREAHEHVRGVMGTPQGVLRISVEAEVGPRLVAPVVADFLQLYPDVRIDLDLSPRRVDLVAEGFDLAVRLGILPDSTLTVRRIGMLQGGLYASPDYIRRRGKPGRPSDLAAHRRIHLLHKGDSGAWRLTRGSETCEVPTDHAVCANHMTMIRYLARLGVGIAVVDALMAAEDIETGALLTILPEWTMVANAISILTPTKLLPAKTRIFVDMLSDAAAGNIGLSP